MRLRIVFQTTESIVLPINYQEYLSAAIYRTLEQSSVDYARFLHDEGYTFEGGPKRFKFFTFSFLRGQRISVGNGSIRYAPGRLEWFIASPLPDFLKHLATGLLTVGYVQAGAARLPISSIEALPDPVLSDLVRGMCLSPIVASVPDPRGTRFLRTEDGEEFSEIVRRNLVRKYQTLYGESPTEEHFTMTFDPAYVSRAPHAGAKKVTVHGIDVIGIMAPFVVSGAEELLRVGIFAGFGEKNSSGFGMVEVGL